MSEYAMLMLSSCGWLCTGTLGSVLLCVLRVLQVKEIVELLDQSARAVRAGPAGARSEGGELAPSVKIVKRQAVMVSATLNKHVSRLAAALLFK